MSGYETTAFNRNRIKINKSMITNTPLDGLKINRAGILMGFTKPYHYFIITTPFFPSVYLPKEGVSIFSNLWVDMKSKSKKIKLDRKGFLSLKSPILKGVK